jgi:hypothetical protein
LRTRSWVGARRARVRRVALVAAAASSFVGFWPVSDRQPKDSSRPVAPCLTLEKRTFADFAVRPAPDVWTTTSNCGDIERTRNALGERWRCVSVTPSRIRFEPWAQHSQQSSSDPTSLLGTEFRDEQTPVRTVERVFLGAFTTSQRRLATLAP